MFEFLGKFIERRWQFILIFWLGLLLLAGGVLNGWINQLGLISWHIPQWAEVTTDGEFAYLPPKMQSLIGEELLAQAFPDDLLNSSVVIVVRRESHPLVEHDEKFIEKVLKPRLEDIRDEADGRISNIRTFRHPTMGKLLESSDGKASLVIVAFTSEFLEWGNGPTVQKIEDLLYDDLVREKAIPLGLDVAMSGSTTVGRDMLTASQESARATEHWTVILVIALLILIYRSLGLALIPLLTVFTSVQIAKAMVVLLSQVPYLHFRVFMGMEVYITVVVYGAGVDYCLFLIARYKEELDEGLGLKEGIIATLRHVGAALTASAGTVICGIGMMVFAEFGKFREAGIGIAISLVVVLCAALTLAPAMLRSSGRWVFWPYGRTERLPPVGGWISGTSLVSRLIEQNSFHVIWERIGRLLTRHPGKILGACCLAMLPFAIIGITLQDWLSYGLLSELEPRKQSVLGAKAVQMHFPAGYAGPLTVLLRNDQVDFRETAGRKPLETLIEGLQDQHEKLGIVDIRYVVHPLGLSDPSVYATREGTGAALAIWRKRQEIRRRGSEEYYISSKGELDGHVTRVDLIFEDDPFSRESIHQLNSVEQAFRSGLADLSLAADTQLHFVGPTASIRDLKTVTDADQVRIDMLVLMGVFLILFALLRKPAISLYLIVSVYFSYLVTLGVAFTVFYLLDPVDFAGLDWKVPMFLFTILIAIGEDYNIFLMTRIEEEQRRHGPVEGVRIALFRTGSIISSCGIIMAGTFCSLMFGTLVGMQQLGFALAFGVLLDTFVVRPILVPAYLILLYSGRFGVLGRFLGQTNLRSVNVAALILMLLSLCYVMYGIN